MFSIIKCKINRKYSNCKIYLRLPLSFLPISPSFVTPYSIFRASQLTCSIISTVNLKKSATSFRISNIIIKFATN